MHTHIIAGKDSTPEETLERIQKTLKSENYVLEILSEQNTNGFYSIFIGIKSSNRFVANGKGITRQLALASAYGEFMERFMTRFYIYDLWLTKEDPLPWVYDSSEIWTSTPEFFLQSLIPFYPDTILKPEYCYDINQSEEGDAYCFLPFKTWDNRLYPIPITFWRELYTSNGLAYGNNLYEARVQALCEIIERHIKFQVIRNGLSLQEIPETETDSISVYQHAKALLAHYGLQCKLLDASLGVGFPVTAFLIFTPTHKDAFLSFGAHPDKEIAIQRTISEAFQGRNLAQTGIDFLNPVVNDKTLTGLPENLESHFINSTGFLHKNIFKQVPSYPGYFQTFQGTSEEEWNVLCQLIEKSGYTVLTRDIFWEDHTACHIIVPGFSEIYPYDDILKKDNEGFCQARNTLLLSIKNGLKDIRKLIEILESPYFEPEKPFGEALGILFPSSSRASRLMIRDLLFLLVLVEEGPEHASFYLDEIEQVTPHHTDLETFRVLQKSGKKEEIFLILNEIFHFLS
ncbi:MAG: YcaO-like family protein [Candidatus Marinimicrobia bacterium]|nr:YcaO-like family protein [Candidatus Neomarinimicrobiota bacterium]MDD5583097.1 YcaO-like family protein [Candidatus Neomarinimicrobiota bacterium]